MSADKIVLWFAQGFGSGRSPFAPGTVGSLVGIPWLLALVATRSWLVIVLLVLASIPLSAWASGRAEKILKEKDPGSVVIDEIIAIPISCLFWLAWLPHLPTPGELLTSYWVPIAIHWGLFRLFDIWKPWPVNVSQRLPGGWGITVDDVLAAGYVNAVVAGFIFLRH